VVANFKMMKTLTEDVSSIVEAVKSSKQVSLDETGTKIKPNFTIARNTVILRDIPSSTPEEEVKGLFSDKNPPLSVRSDIGDTWFVVFETDELALEALEYIRTKTFRDKPIHARIKSDNLLKSFSSSQQAYLPNYSHQNWIRPPLPAAAAAFQFDSGRFRGGMPRGDGGPRRGGPMPRGQRGGRDYYNPKPKNGTFKEANAFYEVNAPRSKVGYRPTMTIPGTSGAGGYQTPAANAASVSSPVSPASSSQQAKTGRGQQNLANNHQKGSTLFSSSRNAANQSKKGSRKQKPLAQPPIPTIDSTEIFPPLPSIPVAERSKSGYGDEFIKYNKQVVIDTYAAIVKTLTKPSDLPANCTAVRDTPHPEMELMKPPDQSIPVVETGNPPSVLESTMISFAEAAITARDIKTPDISNEHLLQQPHRKRHGSNAKAPDAGNGRKRSDSTRSRSSSAAATPLIKPEPQRPEPKKLQAQQQKPEQPKKKDEQKKKESNTAAAVESRKNTAFSYASVLQQHE
jgi:hypothetical protein